MNLPPTLPSMTAEQRERGRWLASATVYLLERGETARLACIEVDDGGRSLLALAMDCGWPGPDPPDVARERAESAMRGDVVLGIVARAAAQSR
jgi:hypothetical protein